MSVESSTAGKEEEKEDDLEMSPVPPPSRSPLIESGLSTEQKEHLLQQVEQLQQDLDEKFIGPTVVEKSDHEKLGEWVRQAVLLVDWWSKHLSFFLLVEKHSDTDEVFHSNTQVEDDPNVKTMPTRQSLSSQL